MARPATPTSSVAAALAAVAAGATVPEAAARFGIGERTLRRYKTGNGAPAGSAAAHAKAHPQSAPPPAPVKRQPAPAVAPPAGPASAPEPGGKDLVAALMVELDYAQQQRAIATEDAACRAWSKRIEELIKTTERLAPPAPVPPDAVAAELRRRDAACLADIEMHLPEPISADELAA